MCNDHVAQHRRNKKSKDHVLVPIASDCSSPTATAAKTPATIKQPVRGDGVLGRRLSFEEGSPANHPTSTDGGDTGSDNGGYDTESDSDMHDGNATVNYDVPISSEELPLDKDAHKLAQQFLRELDSNAPNFLKRCNHNVGHQISA